MDYIDDNPVKAGIVFESYEYLYRSPRNYNNRDSVIKRTSIYDGEEIYIKLNIIYYTLRIFA